MKKPQTVFPLGTALLTYNKWTGWNGDFVKTAFIALTIEEIERLRSGTYTWVDVDPIHPNGKVYGRFKVRITQIEKTPSGTRIYFASPKIRGSTLIEKNMPSHNGKLARLKNERSTFKKAQKQPLATRID